MADFTFLAASVHNWLDMPLERLPEALADRVKREFFPNEWDALTPSQRLSISKQCDAQNDPARQAENLYWWNFAVRIDELGKHIAKWESKPAPTISELAQQETMLLELRAQLAAMETEFKRGTYPPAKSVDSIMTGVERLDQISDHDHLAAFRSMENLMPHEVKISFVGDKSPIGLLANNLLELAARGVRRRVSLGEFGLSDHRNGAPNHQAIILLGMAAGDSPKLALAKNTTKIGRLRKTIRDKLGIKTDPFLRRGRQSGWEPKFSVSDARGLSDTRAREDFLRKTTSFDACLERGMQFAASPTENDFDDENDDTARWIKANERSLGN